MKKLCLTAALVTACLFSLGVSGFAQAYSVAVNGIMVPFEIGQAWYVSVPGSVDAHFKEGNDLTDSYFNDYMNMFGYSLWMQNAKNDNEIRLVVEAAQAGKKDYAAMSEAELLAEANDFLPTEADAEIRVAKTEKFLSGNLLFLRREIALFSDLYAVYYTTVANGVSYELRLTSLGDGVQRASVTQEDALVNDLAAALTLPDAYPTAPATTAYSAGRPDVELDLAAGTIVSPTAAGAQTPGTQQTSVDSQTVAEVGAEPTSEALQTRGGEAVTTLGTYTPSAAETEKSNTIYWLIGAAALVIVCAGVVLLIVKRRKGQKS